VAISNHRLIAFDGERVTFRWKDYARDDQWRTMIARRPASPYNDVLRVEDLTLDPASREVTRGQHVLPLTRTEFMLLEYLMRRTGRVVTREAIIEAVWGYERDIENNTLDVFVSLLPCVVPN
jgi:DNA-binding response OmpR family regulator